MIKQVSKAITMLGLLMFLGVVSAYGQSRGQIEVNMPFDFTAGETRLSAGAYTVKAISDRAVLLRSADGKSEAILNAPRTISPNTKQEAMAERLVFHRYGNSYFLSQVWILRTLGRDLDRSTAERRASTQSYFEKKEEKPETAEVGAGTR